MDNENMVEWFTTKFLPSFSPERLREIIETWTPGREASDADIDAMMARGSEWLAAERAAEERDACRQIGCAYRGCRDGGDNRIVWWVFPAGTTAEAALKALDDAGYWVDGKEIPPSAYDCTGRWGAFPMEVTRVTRTRTLVVQSWYQDV